MSFLQASFCSSTSLTDGSRNASHRRQANAPEPLVRMLGEADLGVCEASLDALLTLVDGQRLQSGGKV
ncbi:hypothetical protein NC652_034295 [Populus alba x Populus x berolinensis]|uniref:Uncharacterized protein n=1 Tax=Populus alba x Populus x berolinensis TaxID=444605 RepID=A0AAD6LM08_9ROSI|nr:hypothetical protein NC652_034295 [Populus alba x Populus x berolinensis]KAJ6969603.1 hypothetical protein NC653_034211 [Populus alba x Populus x berolinensis]